MNASSVTVAVVIVAGVNGGLACLIENVGPPRNDKSMSNIALLQLPGKSSSGLELQ